MPAPASRRSLAGTLSVLLHAGVLIGFAFLPERPPPEPALDLRTIELLPPDFEAERPKPPEPELAPEPPPEPEATPPEPEEVTPPEPEATPPEPEVTPPPVPSAPPEAPPPDAPPEASPAEATAQAPSTTTHDGAAPALALLGRRDSASGSPLSPRVRWSPPNPAAPMHSGAAADAAQPLVDKPPPRSLEEAGFVQRRNGNIVYRDPLKRFNATLHPDGRVTFRNRIGNPFTTGMPGLQEGLREAADQELYRAAKHQLLEETRALREAYAMRNAKQAIDTQLHGLEHQLRAIWQQATMSAEDRRALLFERWDECEEAERGNSSLSELELARKQAGDRARRVIEAFIRRTLPAGSKDAFSEDELRAFNARRTSAQRFSPYRAG